jgi:hypothetical protein
MSREQLLHRRWIHSHEEDTEGRMVFRPAGFDLPPSRGRTSFELRPDGVLVEGGPGPDDRPTESAGTWELGGDDRLTLRSRGREPRTLAIESVEDDRLVVSE